MKYCFVYINIHSDVKWMLYLWKIREPVSTLDSATC